MVRADPVKIVTDGPYDPVIITNIGELLTDPVFTGDAVFDAGVDVQGELLVGSGADTVEISKEFGILLNGDATVYDDLRVDALLTRPGVVAPTDEGGFAGDANMYARNFLHTQADEVQFDVQMPHAWKEGGILYPHVHFVPWVNLLNQNYNVQFIFSYFWTNIDGIFVGNQTYTVTRQFNGASCRWNHFMAENAVPLLSTGMTTSSILKCRLYRDNSVGSNFGARVTLLYIDFHYEINRLGSDEP